MKAPGSWRKLSGLVLTGCFALALMEPLMAQEGAALEYEEILVTGERVERSLFETASSVAVFNAQYLQQLAAADRIEQVLDFVPNLQRGANDTGVSIRGQDSTGILIGANAFLGGTRPRATLQIDGRTLNFNEFIYGLSSIWDVKQIEVFRGPQTTSQGRNAIAGAFFVKTKDPSFEFEGKGRAIGGNYGTRQVSVALSGPIVGDQLAARITVDRREHESWMNYTALDLFEGVAREDDNYVSARAKLLYKPSALPELELLLTYSHLDSSNPQGETADEPFDERIQSVQNGAHWDTKVDSLALNSEYAISEAWHWSLTGTMADSQSERFTRPGAGLALVEADEYSFENLLRFAPKELPFSALFGLASFTADQDESSDLSAFLGFGDFNDQQQSHGVFGEATFDLSDKLHLTFGARWQEDNQQRVGALGPVSLDYDESFNALLPKAEIAYDLQHEVIIGASLRKGFNPGGTTISFVTGDVDEFDAETLWSYELFSRAKLADGEFTLSGNLFFSDFKNAQRPLVTVVQLPDGSSTQSTEFANAPKAESYGFEAEAQWQASSALHLRSSLGYIESEITETLLDNDPILGKAFQRAPKISAALGVNIFPDNALSFSINARYNSSYFSDDANTQAFKIDGGSNIDAQANYRIGKFSSFAFVRNVSDRTYAVWQFREGNASLGDPREYGLGLEYRL